MITTLGTNDVLFLELSFSNVIQHRSPEAVNISIFCQNSFYNNILSYFSPLRVKYLH